MKSLIAHPCLLLILPLVLFSGVIADPAIAQIEYELTDLGALPGNTASYGYDINDFGEIVGISLDADFSSRPFFWSESGGMESITMYSGTQDSYAVDLNNHGDVAGYSILTGTGVIGHVWNSTTGLTQLDDLDGQTVLYGFGINDGKSAAASSEFLAGTWNETDGSQLIGHLGGFTSRSYAINELNQISGLSYVDTTTTDLHAFFYDPVDGMIDMGELPGGLIFAEGNDLNNFGTVVGTSDSDRGQTAFVWTQQDGMLALPPVPGTGSDENKAYGINDFGQIVGVGGAVGDPIRAGFIYSDALGMQNVNDMLDASGNGWSLISANSVNAFGQIVATGTAPDGETRPVRLTPVSAAPIFLTVIKGILNSGSVDQLTLSDDLDASISRSSNALAPVVTLTAQAVIPTANPDDLELTVEASVFARGNVVQIIEFYNFDSGSYETIDSRNASRQGDIAITAAATGDLSRFVEDGTQNVQARITYQAGIARAQFSANIDRITWEF